MLDPAGGTPVQLLLHAALLLNGQHIEQEELYTHLQEAKAVLEALEGGHG
jgi:hypothetical protein